MGKGAIFLVQNNGDFNKKTLIEQHGYIVYTVYPYYGRILTMALYKRKTRFLTQARRLIKKKSTRWEKALYSLSKVHGDFNKKR